jgi:ribosomal protein S18 acetylase RimI-like enzyme
VKYAVTPADVSFLDVSDLVAVAQCIALDATAFPYASAQFGMRSRLSCVLLVRGEPRNGVLGFLAGAFQRRDRDFHSKFYCKGLAVDPAVRRLGIGRALVQAGIGHARDHGARAMVLNVWIENEAAIALYESEGFTVRRRLPGFYTRGHFAGSGDAYEMAREWPTAS